MSPPLFIGQRLTRLTALTAGGALALACAIFIAFEWHNSIEAEKRSALAVARVTADASGAFLAFRTQTEAANFLRSFRAEPDICAAALYDVAGGLFAEYSDANALPPPRTAPPSLGLDIRDQRLHLTVPVVDEGRTFGTFYLQTDLGPAYARLWHYVWVALVVFLAVLIAASVLAQPLRRSISDPILALAQVAETIARRRDYRARAHAGGIGEVATLTEAFNHMLEKIEQQQTQLEAEKRLLATTLASIGDGVIVTDAAGCIVSLNPEAERLTGWKDAEATGRRLPDVFQIINEASRATVESPVEKVLRLGTVVGLANHTLLIRKDRSEVPIDDSAAPIRETGGPISGVVLVFRDFTERKQAEQTLRESEARERARATELEATMEATPAIIWIARDPECRVIAGNRLSDETLRLTPKTNASLTAPEAERPTHFEVWSNGRRLPPTELPVQRAARGEEVRGLEEELRFDDGTVRYLFGHATPLRRADGEVYGAVAAFIDITGHKQAAEELRRARDELVRMNSTLDQAVHERTARLQEMVDELQHVSYAMAHDMRAPLRAMGGFAELLTEEVEAVSGSETARDYCRRISVAATRMDRLIRDALNYSRAVLDRPTLVSVRLFGLLRSLVETYPNLHQDQADIDLDPNLPTVLGDESLLTQCFSNLLGNAVKFVPPDTRAQVRVRADPVEAGEVRVWVEDNGIGIPSAAQSRLFGMFQKLDNRYEGTGIGLAIVRKVVERMDGSVGVVSIEGQGSRFWVKLRTPDLPQ